MKFHRLIFTFLTITAFTSHLHAQDLVRLDPAAMSGLGLEGGPIREDADSPVRYMKRLYEGEKFLVTVEAGNGPNNSEVLDIASFFVTEFCYILNGSATFIATDGRTETFYAGDFYVIPRGFAGKMITQGNHLYQVMHVVSTERGDPIPGAFPTLIDRANMAGLGLDPTGFGPNGELEANVKPQWQGTELTVSVLEVEPNSMDFTDRPEEFIYVLNGTATLTPVGGEPQTFYSGEFFIVPEGWDGNWTVDGNHLYRALNTFAVE
ncbi:MAG: cupin domain-containing protein [Gammaproteobacteria bacterium]|nr:cupin domain-containing protein [Gammaproteobacteria bacterium]